MTFWISFVMALCLQDATSQPADPDWKAALVRLKESDPDSKDLGLIVAALETQLGGLCDRVPKIVCQVQRDSVAAKIDSLLQGRLALHSEKYRRLYVEQMMVMFSDELSVLAGIAPWPSDEELAVIQQRYQSSRDSCHRIVEEFASSIPDEARQLAIEKIDVTYADTTGIPVFPQFRNRLSDENIAVLDSIVRAACQGMKEYFDEIGKPRFDPKDKSFASACARDMALSLKRSIAEFAESVAEEEAEQPPEVIPADFRIRIKEEFAKAEPLETEARNKDWDTIDQRNRERFDQNKIEAERQRIREETLSKVSPGTDNIRSLRKPPVPAVRPQSFPLSRLIVIAVNAIGIGAIFTYLFLSRSTRR